MQKFSVIIPSHNEGGWLRKTVEGISEITNYPDYEIVVVGDGCTDGSFQFLKQDRNFSLVKLIELNESYGSAKARNIGGKEATGDYLVFVDSHVIPEDKNWLHELGQQLENPKVGASTIKISSMQDPNLVGFVYTIGNLELEPTWVIPENIEKIQKIPLIPGACFAIRRDVFKKTGGFDAKFKKWGREDCEFSLRLWRMGFDLSFSPNSAISHYFKEALNFPVSHEEVDFNILRIAFILLSEHWAKKVIKHITKKRPESTSSAIYCLIDDAEFPERKKILEKEFARSFDEYLEEFSEMLPLLRESLTKPLNSKSPDGNNLYKKEQNEESHNMTSAGTKRECPSCGATNVGEHDHCLICQASLTSVQVETQVQPTQPAERRCTNPQCGQIVPEGKKFCTLCGTPVADGVRGAGPPELVEQNCPKCSQIVPEGKKFCTACGTPVK
jgi:GT2 family glycosyltransferase